MRERVDHGAAILDEVKPNWYYLIDQDNFEIMSPHRCVLGQVFPSFVAGCNALYGASGNFGSLTLGGFACTPEEADDLNEAWLAEITLRRTLDSIGPRPSEDASEIREEALV